MESKSEIREFYVGKTILITGGTGFLGKILIEKLLRCCDVRKIYVIVRCKKGKAEADRFEELFEQPVFDRLKIERPDFRQKVALITGDCVLPKLGLSELDEERLIEEVEVVFHCAATVRFDQKLKTAGYINVRATVDLCEMARKMPHLNAFLHVSTAYSFCPRREIDEVFYKPKMTPEQLMQLVEILTDEQMLECNDSLLDKWPNTYAFSKSIGEEAFRQNTKGLPAAMIRPSIVISTYSEPMPGWIDNFYGPIGVSIAAGVGLLRTLHADPLGKADLVPADYVVNAMLVATWKASKAIEEEAKVYNYVSSMENPLDWKTYMMKTELFAKKVPTTKIIWHYCFALHKSKFMHQLSIIFLHLLPAYVVDFIVRCLGKKPLLVDGYKRIHRFIDVIAYFSTRQWNFTNDNTRALWKEMNPADKQLFFFSMAECEWDRWFKGGVMGARTYLLKDTPDTIPKAGRKTKMLMAAHYTIIGLVLLLVLKCLMYIFNVLI